MTVTGPLDTAVTTSSRDLGPKRIRDHYDRGSKAINSEAQRYWVNLAFLQGDQWIFWNVQSNRIETVERSDETRVRATVNRLAATMRRLISKSVKRSLVFEVPPTAADDATVRGARIAESILSDLKREQDWENLREELSIATFNGGTGLLCLDWDAEAGQEIETDDETGQVISTGDCRVTTLAITEAVSEPGTADIEKAQWWIKAQAIPNREVKELYGLKELPAADATTALSPVQRKILAQDRNYQPQDLSLVLTYYERPSKENKTGVVAVVVGDKIVDGPHSWPFPFTDRLNVVSARETKVLNRWTGDTILSHAVPVQTMYNAVWSNMVEHLKLAGNARILWPQFAGDAVDALDDGPGGIVEYNWTAGAPKPEYWVPPGFAPEFLKFAEEIASQMDDILGVHDVSRGEAPRNIESGQGLAILAEQDETPIAHVTKEVADAFARVGSLILECYAQKVQETRNARVDFPHQVSQTVQWTGQDLMGQTTVIVPEGAVTPVSKAETWTKGINLYDRGQFGPPGSPESSYKFSRYIAGSGEENFIEATDPDVAKAERENYKLALGQPELISEVDDDAAHIRVVENFMKTATFERLPEEFQQLFWKHRQAHQVQQGEKAAKAANRQMQDIGTGHLAALTDGTGSPTPQLGAGNGSGPPDGGQPGAGGGGVDNSRRQPAPWTDQARAGMEQSPNQPGPTEQGLQGPMR